MELGRERVEVVVGKQRTLRVLFRPGTKNVMSMRLDRDYRAWPGPAWTRLATAGKRPSFVTSVPLPPVLCATYHRLSRARFAHISQRAHSHTVHQPVPPATEPPGRRPTQRSPLSLGHGRRVQARTVRFSTGAREACRARRQRRVTPGHSSNIPAPCPVQPCHGYLACGRSHHYPGPLRSYLPQDMPTPPSLGSHTPGTTPMSLEIQ